MKFYILQEKIKEIKTSSSKYLEFMLAGISGFYSNHPKFLFQINMFQF